MPSQAALDNKALNDRELAEERVMLTSKPQRLVFETTNRCNLRCVYCMPKEGLQWQPHADQLSAEEIVRVVETAARGGVKRVRLTGGEPLVHPQIVEIVHRIASIPGIEEVSLTTNAMLLERLAQPLADAGLTRVNISLDSLNADKFRQITRGGDLSRVWKGIVAAEAAHLAPLKLNTVIVRVPAEHYNAIRNLPGVKKVYFSRPRRMLLDQAAAIQNAQAFQKVQAEFGSFDRYIWTFVGGKPIVNAHQKLSTSIVLSVMADAASSMSASRIRTIRKPRTSVSGSLIAATSGRTNAPTSRTIIAAWSISSS